MHRMESVGNVLKLLHERVHMRFCGRYGGRFGASLGAELHQHSTQCRHLNIKTHQPMTGSVLMVPLYRSVHATVPSSIECISENGGKYALPEAQAKGAFWLPESVRLSNQSVGRIGIAEGIATALSISQVLGFPCIAARSS